MTGRPRIRVEDVHFFERHVSFRMPFRFGIVTLTEAPQVFVRAQVRIEDNLHEVGQAAELLAPKWFDKDPGLTNEQNFDQLRKSLAIARRLMLAAADGPLTAFGLHAEVSEAQYKSCAEIGLNRLIGSFGTALLDRAVLDALCRATGASVFESIRANLPGLDAGTTPDLNDFDLDGFLSRLTPSSTIDARHTVGLVDAIRDSDLSPDSRIGDGLPESLESVLAKYGHRYFKLKVSGDIDADIERLTRIASVLDELEEPYYISLDGNEQFDDVAEALELLRRIAGENALKRLYESILYVEQPITRNHALDRPIHDLANLKPVAVDESDADIGVFPKAHALGYRGISSKSCKGFYRSVLNRARAERWNASEAGAPNFMTAEDLTTQAGIALQQDLALATLIGCKHIERNGHHYVDGMSGAPQDEMERFLHAHRDLYHRAGPVVRVTIRDGKMAIGSLNVPGLGVAAEPDWDAMTRMEYEG